MNEKSPIFNGFIEPYVASFPSLELAGWDRDVAKCCKSLVLGVDLGETEEERRIRSDRYNLY